jgi:dethiobiotin synthetase
MRKPVPGLFITGTDTSVGKTYVAAIIARDLTAAGHRVGVYKPAASGCRREGHELVSDDAVALWEAAGRPGELARVCLQRFAAPLAPHLAARAEGRRIDTALLTAGLDYWLERSDVVLVEGAGGLMSPIADEMYVADLAAELRYPLVIVAANVLGVINHTLQTLITAASHRGGLPVAGVVVNQARVQPHDVSVTSNLHELQRRSRSPILGEVAWQGQQVTPGVDWAKLARAPGN